MSYSIQDNNNILIYIYIEQNLKQKLTKKPDKKSGFSKYMFICISVIML